MDGLGKCTPTVTECWCKCCQNDRQSQSSCWTFAAGPLLKGSSSNLLLSQIFKVLHTSKAALRTGGGWLSLRHAAAASATSPATICSTSAAAAGAAAVVEMLRSAAYRSRCAAPGAKARSSGASVGELQHRTQEMCCDVLKASTSGQDVVQSMKDMLRWSACARANRVFGRVARRPTSICCSGNHTSVLLSGNYV